MHGFALTPFLEALPVTVAAAAVVIIGTFLLALATKRHAVVDVAWGLAFVAIAATACALSAGHGDSGQRGLLLVLVAAWGLRLAGHIAVKNRGSGEDPRYAELLAGGGAHPIRYAIRKVYLTQLVVLWFVSLPVQVGMFERSGPTVLSWIGTAVWAVGLFFEAVGDYQLLVFKADPANEGAIMDHGLWRYTRHPNYFGDATVWWGIFLTAAAHLPGVFFVLSPLAMTAILTKGTGKNLTEQRMNDARPDYREYVTRTSGFLPLPPRRSPA